MAASLGVHFMRMGIGMRTGGLSLGESLTANVPMPVFGVHGEYALTRDLHLRGGVEFFYVDLEDIDGFDFAGHLLDTRLGLEDDLLQHVGVGVGFNDFRLNMELDQGRVVGRANYEYQGLLLYLRTYF